MRAAAVWRTVLLVGGTCLAVALLPTEAACMKPKAASKPKAQRRAEATAGWLPVGLRTDPGPVHPHGEEGVCLWKVYEQDDSTAAYKWREGWPNTGKAKYQGWPSLAAAYSPNDWYGTALGADARAAAAAAAAELEAAGPAAAVGAAAVSSADVTAQTEAQCLTVKEAKAAATDAKKGAQSCLALYQWCASVTQIFRFASSALARALRLPRASSAPRAHQCSAGS